MKPGPREGFRWTRESIIYAIELWHRKHLRIPTTDEWDAAGPDHPSRVTVIRRFGSWNAAMEAAGFRPRRPGERMRTSLRTSRRGTPLSDFRVRLRVVSEFDVVVQARTPAEARMRARSAPAASVLASGAPPGQVRAIAVEEAEPRS